MALSEVHHLVKDRGKEGLHPVLQFGEHKTGEVETPE